MKIRNGFVSNSSSSSFIISFDKTKKNVKDIKNFYNLKDYNEEYIKRLDWYDEEDITRMISELKEDKQYLTGEFDYDEEKRKDDLLFLLCKLNFKNIESEEI